MTLLPPDDSPLEDIWVSLDLETTGLSPDLDEIIEVGAVKFQGSRTIDTFQSFANPHRRLSDFIKRHTGITQREVDGAPAVSRVVPELAAFVGASPVVGHNVSFDLGFLSNNGLKMSNPSCDTRDLAFVLLPKTRDYSLGGLCAYLDIAHASPHRAVNDATVTKDLFQKLVDIAAELDAHTLAEMERLAGRSSWGLSYLLRRLAVHAIGTAGQAHPAPRSPAAAPGRPAPEAPSRPEVGVTGLDVRSLKSRLGRTRTLRPNETLGRVDVDQVGALLSSSGPLAGTMPGFDEREEQIAMARAVASAINEGQRLIVEAGTGVGKSLAYLLPAVLYALKNNRRVVVSTNTINLQEQLLTKDVPALLEALAEVKGVGVEDFRFAQLKGRSNYLCLKRWFHLRSAESLSQDEARVLSKVLMWLGTTASGDRSELNLGGRGSAAAWDRLSAQGAQDCQGVQGMCFLRSARDAAAASHLVVVNHALLMSDLVPGRALIPDYDILIVDEAHHLEEVATRHLGFELSQNGLDDHFQSLAGDRGLVNRTAIAFRGSSAADSRKATAEEVSARLVAVMPSLRQGLAGMFALLGSILSDSMQRDSEFAQELRVTSSTRSQPAWSEIEVQWENIDASLALLQRELEALYTALEGLEEAGLLDYEGLVIEALNAVQQLAEIRRQLTEFIPHPEAEAIYWASRTRRGEDLALHSAPLHVGERLDELLFGRKECVVLTSATLSTDGTFQHIKERTGFKDSEELLVGSPFDYPRAAMLCVPNDVPEPTTWAYQEAVERAITDAGIAVGGSTMALFTSHAALQATARAIREPLRASGLEVLAQGLDGPPYRLLERFLENPRSVLLGTASFWEGVDLAGDSLKVLLVARLPFSVPTEPVFAARSELYENSFMEYALPQAILRLRQGFGRLIRTRTDKGVVVILDRRIILRRYGESFVRSLPQVGFKACASGALGEEIHRWLTPAPC